MCIRDSTNSLLNYSPTVSRIISLDAEDLTGYTNGQSVTGWDGWIPDNPAFPPTYSTFQGGKFVLFASNNQRLRYPGGFGLNSDTEGWTINFQTINIPNGTILTLQSTSPAITITVYFASSKFYIDYTISGSTTTLFFDSNYMGGYTSNGWFDSTISYNPSHHQLIANVSGRVNHSNYTHIIEIPNASFNSVIFGGNGISNMYLNRLFVYSTYMNHLHNYNRSMNTDSEVFIPSSFTKNWRKQAIILSKITYGDNKYVVCGRDQINDSYVFRNNNSARQILFNTSPLFKSTNDMSSWSSMLNTGMQSSANSLKYLNSNFYITSNETYDPLITNYTTRPTRILTSSNLNYWINVGDKNNLLVPNLSLPTAPSPLQLLSSIVNIFFHYMTGVWYAAGMSNDASPNPSIIRYNNG